MSDAMENDSHEASSTAKQVDGELAQMLDEELSRLPERLRAAIVLCDMEDLTHEQAAAQLGWPVGTVKSRLARGRQRLRSRLVRRGLAPSLVFIGAVPAEALAGSVVPPALVGPTVEAALRFGASRFAVEMIPPEVGSLIKSEAKAMWMKSLRWKAAAILALGGVALGAGLTWSMSPAQQAAIREEAKLEAEGHRDEQPGRTLGSPRRQPETDRSGHGQLSVGRGTLPIGRDHQQGRQAPLELAGRHPAVPGRF